MKNIYLFELSDIFANQVYLPYSSGVVWSYLKNNPTIQKNYKLKDWFFVRDDASNIIKKIEDPFILLFLFILFYPRRHFILKTWFSARNNNCNSFPIISIRTHDITARITS